MLSKLGVQKVKLTIEKDDHALTSVFSNIWFQIS